MKNYLINFNCKFINNQFNTAGAPGPNANIIDPSKPCSILNPDAEIDTTLAMYQAQLSEVCGSGMKFNVIYDNMQYRSVGSINPSIRNDFNDYRSRFRLHILCLSDNDYSATIAKFFSEHALYNKLEEYQEYKQEASEPYTVNYTIGLMVYLDPATLTNTHGLACGVV